MFFVFSNDIIMPSIFDFGEQSFWLFVVICLFILFFMVYKIKPISNYFAEAFEDQVTMAIRI
jgi:hypothetical protein